MAHLIKIMELIQKVSSEYPEIDATLKDIVRLREENDALKNEKAQLDNDFNYLQKELRDMENMIADCPAPIESQLHIVQGLKIKINELDLDKMVLCDIMKLEKEYGDDWQLYKDLTEEHLKQQTKLRQRDIVKEYHIIEETLNNTRRISEELNTAINERITISRKERRQHDDQINKLIVEVIKGAKKLEQQQEEIEQLKLLKKDVAQLEEEDMPKPTVTESVTDISTKEITKYPSLMDMIRKDVNSIPQILTYIHDEFDNNEIKKSVQFKEPLAVVKTFSTTNNNADSDVVSESSCDYPMSPSNQKKQHENYEIDSCMVIEETDEEQELENGNLVSHLPLPLSLPLENNNTNTNINNNENGNEVTSNHVTNANDVTLKEMPKNSVMLRSPIGIQECLIVQATANNNNENNDNNSNKDINEKENLFYKSINVVEAQTTVTATQPTTSNEIMEQAITNLSQKSFHDDFERYLNEFQQNFLINIAEEPTDYNEQELGESTPLTSEENPIAAADPCNDNNFFTFDDYEDDTNSNNDNNYVL